jgi:hypothetical protein
LNFLLLTNTPYLRSPPLLYLWSHSQSRWWLVKLPSNSGVTRGLRIGETVPVCDEHIISVWSSKKETNNSDETGSWWVLCKTGQLEKRGSRWWSGHCPFVGAIRLGRIRDWESWLYCANDTLCPVMSLFRYFIYSFFSLFFFNLKITGNFSPKL